MKGKIAIRGRKMKRTTNQEREQRKKPPFVTMNEEPTIWNIVLIN